MSRRVTEQRLNNLSTMQLRWMEIAEARREDRFDNFLFLVRSGTSVEDAAKRVGSNPVALARQAYRHGRYDIAQLLSKAARHQRYHR